MKTSTILKGVATVALLTSFGAAKAEHLPSPCANGEVGQGSNCMYIVATGTGASNTYDPGTGNRSAITTTTLSLGVWMDFGQIAVQGGGFDIILSNNTNVTSMTWTWGADFTAGEQTLDGAMTPNGWEGIQFDDFAGDGFGGSTGTQPGFSLVGTLTVELSGASSLIASIAQPYTDSTFPNCFAPGAGSGGSGCVDTNFYNLSVQANPVPLPAALWMMIAGMGSLAGFARRSA